MTPRKLTHARAGLVLACLGTLSFAIGSTLAGCGIMCAVAWFAGAITATAHRTYRQRLELERRKELELKRRKELEELELALMAAPDEASRVALLERLARLEVPYRPFVAVGLALALLGGCAAAHDEPDCAELPELDPILTLPADECAGWYVDQDTAFSGHPETGACSFRCEGPRDVHLCAAFGGRCQPAADGVRYCEAP